MRVPSGEAEQDVALWHQDPGWCMADSIKETGSCLGWGSAQLGQPGQSVPGPYLNPKPKPPEGRAFKSWALCLGIRRAWVLFPALTRGMAILWASVCSAIKQGDDSGCGTGSSKRLSKIVVKLGAWCPKALSTKGRLLHTLAERAGKLRHKLQSPSRTWGSELPTLPGVSEGRSGALAEPSQRYQHPLPAGLLIFGERLYYGLSRGMHLPSPSIHCKFIDRSPDSWYVRL